MASEVWGSEVEAKLAELHKLVDEMWGRGDVESATAGEGLITAVQGNRDAVNNMVEKYQALRRTSNERD